MCFLSEEFQTDREHFSIGGNPCLKKVLHGKYEKNSYSLITLLISKPLTLFGAIKMSVAEIIYILA